MGIFMNSVSRLSKIGVIETERALFAYAKKFSSEAPSKTFDYLTRYLPNRDQFLAKASSSRALVSHLEKGDWHAIEKSYSASPDKLAIDGLKALEQGAIQTSQLSTLIFRWSLIKDFPDAKVQVISLFDDAGNVNLLADGFIRQTLKESRDFGEGGVYLNEDQLSSFYKRMKEKPLSEQLFFYMKVKEPPKDRYVYKTIVQRIQQLGNNVFNEFSYKGEYYEMIGTHSMLQEFLIAYGGTENAVTITPTFNISTKEDIAINGLRDERDMALPFVDIQLPEELDTFPVSAALQSIRHDFHHCLTATNIPAATRRAFIEYSEAVLKQKSLTENPKVRYFLDVLYRQIIDMDFPYFKKLNPPQLLLTSPLLSNSYTPKFLKDFFKREILIPSTGEKFSGTIQFTYRNAIGYLRFENVISHKKLIDDVIDTDAIKANIAKTLDKQGFSSRHDIPRSYLL